MTETPATLAQSEMQEVLGLAMTNSSQPAKTIKPTQAPTSTTDLAEQEGQQPKYHWGAGKGQPAQSWASKPRPVEKGLVEQEDKVEELTNRVRLLAKVVLRHEDEHSRLRVESGFSGLRDTGEHGVTGTLFKMAQAWKAKKEEGTVSNFLRVTLFPRDSPDPAGQVGRALGQKNTNGW